MLNKYCSYSKQYINVLLNTKGIIFEIETNIETILFNKNDIIGKDWFDTFVDIPDRIKTIEFFQNIIETKSKKSKVFSYDIKSHHGNHEYIDFQYEIYEKNGETYVLLFGKTHYLA